MIEKDKNIRKGLAPSRDKTCYQLQHAIVLPAGTILRADALGFSAAVENGAFTISGTVADHRPELYKKVVA